MLEEFLRFILLQKVSAVHKHDAGGNFSGKAHLMGTHHHGHLLVRQIPHNVQHLAYHLRIERRRRFVKEHDVRVHTQGADNGDSLLLSAG